MMTTMVSATGKSREAMEATSSRPMPGTTNTCSTMMEPATMSARDMARYVTTGKRALRSTWVRITIQRELPRL